MNQDFNLNRIERYLALVSQAEAEPVIVLSKADLVAAPQEFVSKVQQIDPMLSVVALNCLDLSDSSPLAPWIQPGKTVALLGSSGVGKSSLINALTGRQVAQTQAIRADDDKGRHTTTGRSLFVLDSGGLVLDTPGMREIQMVDCEQGIENTFADIEQYAQSCRFNDCSHRDEPHCAVKQAIAEGKLQQRRLDNYLKLSKEQAFNSRTLAESRAKDKALGKYYRRTQSDARRFKGR